MAELRDEGAIAFTDDGKPVVSAGMMRKALQYQRLAGGLLALHEEDPALSGRGAMHEGEVSALLGIAGIPSVSESTMVARDCALAAYEGGRIHIQHLSCARVGRGGRGGQGRPACRSPARPRPHHLCLTERGGPRPRHADEDEPAAAHRGRPPGADRGPALGRRSTASPPTTPRTRATRRRSPSSRRRWARPAWRPPSPRSTPSSWSPACSTSRRVVERMTAGGEPFGIPAPRRARWGRRPTSCSSTSPPSGRWARTATRAARSTAASPGRALRGRVLLTLAAGGVAYRERAFAVTAA